MSELLSIPFFTSKPWFENSNSIWMSSHFELHRNLDKHFFPHKLEPAFQKKLSLMLAQTLLSSPLLKRWKVFSMFNLNPMEKQLLYEYYFSKKDFVQFRDHELILIDPEGSSHISINMEDHLLFSKLDFNENLEETWTYLLKIESSLAKSLEFAFSPKFGFGTSDPNKCGTGLCIRTSLHLPALIHLGLLADKIQKANSNFFDLSGFGGDLVETLGDLIIISNRQTLGLSEETLLKNIRRLTLELFIAEKITREQLSKDQSILLKDKVGKGFGILKHATKLSLTEALSGLSLCKLGLEMDWLKGISIQEINRLFYTVRKSYLQLNFPDRPIDELDKVRAEHIHLKMKLMDLIPS
jgi:protein arginine kinase